MAHDAAMEAYPLPARPLPIEHRWRHRSSTCAAPRRRRRRARRAVAVAVGVEYVRRCVAASAMRSARASSSRTRSRRSTPARAATSTQLARVLEALDDGRAVAFYGWWPTAELAGVSDILGVDAMDVPPPDRKGAGLADGHAVVALGYGRHAAFPGGGYLIVRNPWARRRVGASRRRLPAVHLRARLRHRLADRSRRGRATAGVGRSAAPAGRRHRRRARPR